MKTTTLASMLATGLDPVDQAAGARRRSVALLAGVLPSIALAIGVLHLNPGLARLGSQPMFWVREAYCAALGVLGVITALRLARPAGRPGAAGPATMLVVLAMWLLAGQALLEVPAAQRAPLVLGKTAAVCPPLIALLAISPFISLVLILRGAAPTRLRLTAAQAGFAAGALGALVYTLHCPELAAPFIGVWYLLGILLPALFGWLLGPRLLGW